MIIHYRPSDVARRLLIAEGLNLEEIENYRIVFKGSKHGVIEEIRVVVEWKKIGDEVKGDEDESDR